MRDYQALNKKVTDLLEAGKYMAAVKLYRKQAGVPLKDAKEHIDALVDKLGLTNQIKPESSKPLIKKILLGFIIFNLLLVIFLPIALNILSSLEYMESLFGLSEWEVDAFRAMLAQKLYLIPLIIFIDLFLFSCLLIMSSGKKVNSKTYIKFLIILLVVVLPFSYFFKLNKNQFKNPEKVKYIFENLQNKRAFRNQPIQVNYINFYIGNVDRQSSIYIIGEFDHTRYTYRPYNLITKWSKDDIQITSHRVESIGLDKLNIDTVIPKIFEFSENIVKEQNLSDRLKGVNLVRLLYTTVNGEYDWYWESSIRVRGARIEDEEIRFDLNGNVVEMSSIFQKTALDLAE